MRFANGGQAPGERGDLGAVGQIGQAVASAPAREVLSVGAVGAEGVGGPGLRNEVRGLGAEGFRVLAGGRGTSAESMFSYR